MHKNSRNGEQFRIILPHLFHLAIAFAVLIFGSALVMWQVERFSGGNVHSFGDALWWAVITITTVGYGDVVPVTVAGKIVGGIVSLIGIIIFLVFISRLTVLFVYTKIDKEQYDALQKKHAIIERLERKELEELSKIEGRSHKGGDSADEQ